MIAKVVRGYRPAGLIRYLFGPGKFEEHTNPRVVASWDGAPWLHHPDTLSAVELDGEMIEPGPFDLDLGPLTRTMTELAEHAGLPTTTPPPMSEPWASLLREGGPLPQDAPSWVQYYRYDARADAVVLKQGYVWHCPVRLHPDDPILSDEQWQYIAERLMKATGIHQAGARWIAVRHADDHIHLMATLVSERTGKHIHPYRDWPKLRAACRALERELGLVRTAGADRTAAPAPTRQEHGKAERLGWSRTARQQLRQTVARCAAASSNGPEFLRALREEGLNPAIVTVDGEIRGYTVSAPGDLTVGGTPVRYSGSKLAPDLTWPKLQARWASAPPVVPVPRGGDRVSALEHATTIVDRAAERVRRDTGTPAGVTPGSSDTAPSVEGVESIAHATGEVLTVLARGLEGGPSGPLTDIADRYDRATRAPQRVLPSRTASAARDLRRASRRIAAAGALSGRGKEKMAGLALMLALAGLVAEIAAWQQRRGRIHQAAAAYRVAGGLPQMPHRPGPGPRRDRDLPVSPATAAGVPRPRVIAPGRAVPGTRGPSRGRREGGDG